MKYKLSGHYHFDDISITISRVFFFFFLIGHVASCLQWVFILRVLEYVYMIDGECVQIKFAFCTS